VGDVVRVDQAAVFGLDAALGDLGPADFLHGDGLGLVGLHRGELQQVGFLGGLLGLHAALAREVAGGGDGHEGGAQQRGDQDAFHGLSSSVEGFDLPWSTSTTAKIRNLSLLCS
jgi:hypothetical protein